MPKNIPKITRILVKWAFMNHCLSFWRTKDSKNNKCKRRFWKEAKIGNFLVFRRGGITLFFVLRTHDLHKELKMSAVLLYVAPERRTERCSPTAVIAFGAKVQIPVARQWGREMPAPRPYVTDPFLILGSIDNIY